MRLNCIPRIKLFAISKTAKLEFFFHVFGANKDSLGMLCCALNVMNFYVATVCARNCIPIIKLLAFSKTAKLDFSFVFSEQIRVV